MQVLHSGDNDGDSGSPFRPTKQGNRQLNKAIHRIAIA